MSEPSFPPDQRNASLTLWRRVRDFVCELFSICGEPQQLAAKHTLTFKDYKILIPWIRAGEALIRRFLLIEAALLEPTANKAAAPAPSKQVHKPAPEMDLENPATWRVSFRAINSSPACGGSGSRRSRETKGELDARAQSSTSPSGGVAATSPARGGGINIAALSPKFRSALPLARRLEAILRVYNDPLPFARRLAARIRKTASLAARICNDGAEKLRNLIGGDLFDALIAPFAEAGRVLAADSS